MQIFSIIFLSLATFFLIMYASTKLLCNFRSSIIVFVVAAIKICIIIGNEIHPLLPVKPDSHFYFNQSIIFLNLNSINEITDFFSSFRGRSGVGIITYVLISSLFYTFFGSYQHVMPLINNFVYLFASILLANSLKLYFRDNAIRGTKENIIVFLLLLYPGAFSNSMYNLRDPLIILFFVIFLRCFLLKKDQLYTYLPFYISILFILLIRPISLVIVTGIIFSYLLFLNPTKRLIHISLSSLLILVLGFSFQEYLKNIFSIDTIIENRYTASLNVLRPYPLDLDYSSFYDMVSGFFIRFFYFLFYPFPWDFASYNYLIPALDSIFHIILIFSTITALLAYFFNNYYRSVDIQIINHFLFLFFSCLIGFFFLTLAEIQFGGAIRHRIPMSMFLCLSLCLLINPMSLLGKSKDN